MRFSQVEHSICHILGMIGPNDVKHKKEMSRLDATLTRVSLNLTFDLELWPFKVKFISGMGGPVVMERKGRVWIGCPDVKYLSQLGTALTGVSLTLTFGLQG